jgi:PAS domain S-box-containing protein
MDAPTSRTRRGRLFHLLGQVAPWLVLLLGLGGTAWGWRVLALQERRYQAIRLEGAVAQTREAVDYSVREQTKLLLSAQGLVVGRPNLGSEDWRAFVTSLGLRQFPRGTRLLGYVSRDAFEGRRGAAPLLEPDMDAALLGSKGEGLVGLPAFRMAAARAMSSGELAVTGRLRLPGEQGASVVLVLPVYRDFAAPAQEAGRLAQFQGLVICVADGGDMFRPMFGASPIAGLDVEIYDSPECREEGLIYDRDLCEGTNGMAILQRPDARRIPMVVGGSQWTLVVGFVPSMAGAREGRPRVVAVGGTLFSLLAFGLTLFLAYSRARLEALTHRLRESEARFRSVAETASCAIFTYSDRIEYMNEAGSRITGYELEELVGEPLEMMVHPLDRDLVRSRARARLRGDSTPLRYEFRLLTKGGQTRWIDFAAGTVSLGGRTLGLGTAFDVTERVKATEARLKVERKLLEAQKLESLGLLAGGVAHDFNNLLTVIQGNAGMAREAVEEPEVALSCLRNIEDTCRRASDLVRQMLAYSGRGRVQVQLLDLNQLVLEIGSLLSVSIPKTVALRFELAEGLPPVSADAAQLQQVVMNLVTNAAEAIGDGEGRVTLRSGTRNLGETDVTGLQVAESLSPGPFVFLEVEDTGSGMDRETQARIFDPFFTTKFTGRGLGLAAMQGIVRGHGGGVEIQSSPGAGTVFRVYLPAQVGLAPEQVGTPAALPLEVPGSGLLLVADDEPGICDFARRVLEGAGFEVVLAADGVEAVEQVRAHQRELRLVLVDLTMPRMGGDEALTEMRALGCRAPAIRWSGYSHRESSGEPGTAFLRKPFSAEDLLMEVRRALR